MGNQEVNVVGDRTSFEQGAILVFNDATNVGVEFIPNVVGQQGIAVFCREDQMHEDVSERLG